LRRVSKSLDFFLGNNSLEQRTHKLGASRNLGLSFSEKKALSNVPTSEGLPEIWGPYLSWKNSLEQRTHKLGASRNLTPFFLSGKEKP